MAKKSSIEKNNKRKKIMVKYQEKRLNLKQELKNQKLSLEEKWIIERKLQSLPRNSAPTRIQKRCFLTGRPRGVYRDFGLSRHVIREMSHECLLPGVTKSSW